MCVVLPDVSVSSSAGSKNGVVCVSVCVKKTKLSPVFDRESGGMAGLIKV